MLEANMAEINTVKDVDISTIFINAESSGYFTDFAAGSDLYNNYVAGSAKSLIAKLKHKPDKLVKVSAKVLQKSYVNFDASCQHTQRKCEFAINLINEMSKILEKK